MMTPYVKNKIRLAMIGGGIDSMIGDVHRYAARLDNCYELVGGAFSTTLAKSQQLGERLGLSESRIYKDVYHLLEQELQLPEALRAEVISVVTPNHTHFDIAKAVMEAGFHLIVDKPLTVHLQEAKQLARIATEKESAGIAVHPCVTYTYCGYPMVKEARMLIRQSELGKIKKVIVDFPQGWLSINRDAENKQARWRLNPQLGIAGTLADIGTHTFHLAEYITGCQVQVVNAQLNRLVSGRALDDDVSMLMEMSNNVVGIVNASQVAAGEEANLNIKVYGECGTLYWQHDIANQLCIKWRDKPEEIKRSGCDKTYLSETALYNCRTPSGHAEGYLEAFANHYRNFAFAVRGVNEGLITIYDYPTLADGVRGVSFIEAVLASARERRWVDV